MDLNTIFWIPPKIIETQFPSTHQTCIFLTRERKTLYRSIIDSLDSYAHKKPYQLHHMITGIQGIGKSFSMWLFAYLIYQSPQKVKPIKVVFIPDCSLLSMYKGTYVIQQLLLQFPAAKEFEGLLSESWETQRKFIYNYLQKMESEGNIIILIVDQINSASNKGLTILDDLKPLSYI